MDGEIGLECRGEIGFEGALGQEKCPVSLGVGLELCVKTYNAGRASPEAVATKASVMVGTDAGKANTTRASSCFEFQLFAQSRGSSSSSAIRKPHRERKRSWDVNKTD